MSWICKGFDKKGYTMMYRRICFLEIKLLLNDPPTLHNLHERDPESGPLIVEKRIDRDNCEDPKTKPQP